MRLTSWAAKVLELVVAYISSFVLACERVDNFERSPLLSLPLTNTKPQLTKRSPSIFSSSTLSVSSLRYLIHLISISDRAGRFLPLCYDRLSSSHRICHLTPFAFASLIKNTFTMASMDYENENGTRFEGMLHNLTYSNILHNRFESQRLTRLATRRRSSPIRT